MALPSCRRIEWCRCIDGSSTMPPWHGGGSLAVSKCILQTKMCCHAAVICDNTKSKDMYRHSHLHRTIWWVVNKVIFIWASAQVQMREFFGYLQLRSYNPKYVAMKLLCRKRVPALNAEIWMSVKKKKLKTPLHLRQTFSQVFHQYRCIVIGF